jgi:pyridoxal phosphate enzyme (YggS family)
MSSIASCLADVRARIDAAARGSQRDPSSVRLIAVSKTFPVEAIKAAYDAGQRDFGENRVQEALEKSRALSGLAIHWHLLGPLQANKVRKAVGAFSMLHAIDSVDLLRKVESTATQAGLRPELLIQVDLAGEATKHGSAPGDVPNIFEVAARCDAARVVGLMLLPPAPDTPEDARPWFARLRDLRDEWLASGVPPSMLRELSMGMSGDFEVAVEEGATLVRVGTAIFGRRHVQG